MRGFCAVGIVGLLPDVLCPCVQQHIACAGVKADGWLLGSKHADVGDAADVEHNAGFVGVGKQGLMKGGDERCALPTCG